MTDERIGKQAKHQNGTTGKIIRVELCDRNWGMKTKVRDEFKHLIIVTGKGLLGDKESKFAIL